MKFFLRTAVLSCNAVLLLLVLSGCVGKKPKRLDEMTFVELEKEASKTLDKKKTSEARVYLTAMITHHGDKAELANYKIALADLSFKEGTYEEAFEIYKNFYQMYPSDVKAEYAHYRAIAALHKQIHSTDRDHTIAEKTIELCKQHKENSQFKGYQEEVAAIASACEKKLIDKEVSIFNFYLTHHKLQSAEKRLSYLKERYMTNKDIEPRLLFLECKLARRKKDQEDIKKTFDRLVNEYPDSQFTHLARGVVGQSTFLF